MAHVFRRPFDYAVHALRKASWLVTGGATTYSHTASGGLTAGGAATLARTQLHTVSGGLAAAGTAAIARTLIPALTGGLTAGGTITVSRAWALAATGGMETGGVATITKTALYTHVASGGLEVEGAATLLRVMASSGIGGMAVGGSAELARALNIIASGGMVTGGASNARKVSIYTIEALMEILDYQDLEPGITVRQGLRLILAALAGKVSGADTDRVSIRNAGDTVTRITADVDQYGNRLAVSYNTDDG